jgi:hypothetical protein
MEIRQPACLGYKLEHRNMPELKKSPDNPPPPPPQSLGIIRNVIGALQQAAAGHHRQATFPPRIAQHNTHNHTAFPAQHELVLSTTHVIFWVLVR